MSCVLYYKFHEDMAKNTKKAALNAFALKFTLEMKQKRRKVICFET
jgi:hypothetical protein